MMKLTCNDTLYTYELFIRTKKSNSRLMKSKSHRSGSRQTVILVFVSAWPERKVKSGRWTEAGESIW